MTASTHILGGGSPYAISSFKSSPLYAYICIPNHFLFPDLAKVLYSITDIIIGDLIWKIVDSQNFNKSNIYAYVTFWLYNPVIIMNCTKG